MNALYGFDCIKKVKLEPNALALLVSITISHVRWNQHQAYDIFCIGVKFVYILCFTHFPSSLKCQSTIMIFTSWVSLISCQNIGISEQREKSNYVSLCPSLSLSLYIYHFKFQIREKKSQIFSLSQNQTDHLLIQINPSFQLASL